MWRKLTTQDLSSALNEAEKPIYESLILAAGQTALVPELLKQVSDDVRSRIAAHKGNKVGPDDTVPDGTIYRLMPLVIGRMMTRLDIEISKDRNKDIETSNTWLRDIANGKVFIERPIIDGPAEEQGKYGNAKTVRKGSRKARRSDMEGLL